MASVSKPVSMACTRFDRQPVLYLWMDGRLIPSEWNKTKEKRKAEEL